MVRARLGRLWRHGDALLDVVVTPPNDRWLWRAAGLLALVLHGGGIVLAGRFALRTEAAGLGMAAPEIRLEWASPDRDPEALPPGPVATSVVAAEKSGDDAAKRHETESTKPTDPGQSPSREAMHRPDEDGTRVRATDEMSSQDPVAPEATSVPSSDTREAPRPAAPVLGTGDDAQRLRSTWEKQLLAHLARHKRYPREAAQQTGEVTLTFVLDRAGYIVRSTVLKGSGDAAIDQAALSMMQRSNPVPPPPPLVAEEGLSFTIPVLFLARPAKK